LENQLYFVLVFFCDQLSQASGVCISHLWRRIKKLICGRQNCLYFMKTVLLTQGG
jgi:hypothetical protein